jgi:hypothetical protein
VQASVFAVVVAKGLFVQVSEQMERLDTDIGAFQPTLQKRPEFLIYVRMDIAVDVAFGVVDHLMHVISGQPIVRTPSVAENVGAAINVFANESLKRRGAGIGDVAQANLLGVAIQQTHQDCFTGPARRRDFASFVLVHEAGETADKRPVNLKLSTTQLIIFIMHRKPDAMKHEPRGFLSNANGAVNLPRANPILAIRDKPHSGEPLIQSERRILEDGSGFNRELAPVVALVALPTVVFLLEGHVVASATRTDDTFTPTPSDNALPAIDRVREVNDCVFKSRGFH